MECLVINIPKKSSFWIKRAATDTAIVTKTDGKRSLAKDLVVAAAERNKGSEEVRRWQLNSLASVGSSRGKLGNLIIF
jgi:hypothetical protein